MNTPHTIYFAKDIKHKMLIGFHILGIYFYQKVKLTTRIITLCYLLNCLYCINSLINLSQCLVKRIFQHDYSLLTLHYHYYTTNLKKR